MKRSVSSILLVGCLLLMKTTSIITAIFLTLFFVLEANAEQDTIRLICKYSYTWNNDGKVSETSGENLITVSYSEKGKATIKKEGLGAEFTGTISDEEIYGRAEYTLGSSPICEILKINRYTGAFSIIIEWIGSREGLVQNGTCTPVTKRKF
jgi:hypothetical protein